MQNIRGDVLSDVLICLILYPFAAVQMHDEALGHAGSESHSDAGDSA